MSGFSDLDQVSFSPELIPRWLLYVIKVSIRIIGMMIVFVAGKQVICV